MPTKSKKQEKFMRAVANSPKFAKKVGVNQSIGREFTQEKDMKKVKKMQMGGMTDREGRAMATGRYANDPRLMADARGRAMMNKGGKVKKMRDGGNTSRTNELEELGRVDAERGYSPDARRNLRDEKARVVREIKGKAAGGAIKAVKVAKKLAGKIGRALDKDKKGMTKAQLKDAGGRAMKKGGMVRGSASKRADGIAQKGHTRGRMF
jgi:hypothetical protein